MKKSMFIIFLVSSIGPIFTMDWYKNWNVPTLNRKNIALLLVGGALASGCLYGICKNGQDYIPAFIKNLFKAIQELPGNIYSKMPGFSGSNKKQTSDSIDDGAELVVPIGTEPSSPLIIDNKDNIVSAQVVSPEPKHWDSNIITVDITLVVAKKPDECTTLVELEKNMLLWQEQALYDTYNKMNEKLRKILPDWGARIALFKERIEKLKEKKSIVHRYEMTTLNVLYALLGLKPLTIEEEERINNYFNKNEMNNLDYKSFDVLFGTLGADNVETLGTANVGSLDFFNERYFINEIPLFNPQFIIAVYSNNNPVIETIKNNTVFNRFLNNHYIQSEDIKHYYAYKGVSQAVFKHDELALALGLQPIYYNVITVEGSENTYNAKNILYCLLPGIKYWADDSVYMQLYSQLCQLFWLQFRGIKEYILYLNKQLRREQRLYNEGLRAKKIDLGFWTEDLKTSLKNVDNNDGMGYLLKALEIDPSINLTAPAL